MPELKMGSLHSGSTERRVTGPLDWTVAPGEVGHNSAYRVGTRMWASFGELFSAPHGVRTWTSLGTLFWPLQD